MEEDDKLIYREVYKIMDIKDLIERADNVASYLEKYYPEYFKDEEIEELSA